MGVWKDLYGPRSRDFIEGVKAGVRMFAVWKDGKQFVGVMREPLEKMLEEIEKDLGGGMFEKEVEEKKKPNCYECAHRGTLPGDTHSKCVHPKIKGSAEDPLTNVLGILASAGRTSPLPLPAENPLNIKGDPRGIQNGWFNWPVNFDPVWLLNCDGFYPKNEPPSHFTEFGEKKK